MQRNVCVGVSLTINIWHMLLLVQIWKQGTSRTLLHIYSHHLLQLHCLCVNRSKQCMDFVQAFVQDDINLSRSNNEYLSMLNESSHSLYVLKVASFSLASPECFPCISIFQVCINLFINCVWQIVLCNKPPIY